MPINQAIWIRLNRAGASRGLARYKSSAAIWRIMWRRTTRRFMVQFAKWTAPSIEKIVSNVAPVAWETRKTSKWPICNSLEIVGHFFFFFFLFLAILGRTQARWTLLLCSSVGVLASNNNYHSCDVNLLLGSSFSTPTTCYLPSDRLYPLLFTIFTSRSPSIHRGPQAGGLMVGMVTKREYINYKPFCAKVHSDSVFSSLTDTC